MHLQVLSRKSRKYFHQAIAMSGTAFNYWATADSNNQLELLYETFKNELHGHRNSTVVLNFMKNAPVELILQKTPAYRILEGKNLLYWAAVIEDPTKAIRPFLTKTPRQIYRTTNIDVPILFGDVTAVINSTPSAISNNLLRFRFRSLCFSLTKPIRTLG